MATLTPNLLSWALDPTFLGDRMSFIAGPRQIGKTTLLQAYLKSLGREQAYFNWDIASVRRAYQHNPDFFVDNTASAKKKHPLPIVFDELHKYPRWKSHLKGLYDAWKGKIRFIVTGSARLDFMRKSGDSLVGRYFLFKRFPLHPRECAGKSEALPTWTPKLPLLLDDTPTQSWQDATRTLLDLNGFPEPFLSGSKRLLTRWQTEHLSLLITEDLSDLTKIDHVLRVEALAELLRHRVGSPLSINNLAKDLQAAFPSVKRWIDALELVYLSFRVPPYTARLARAIRKESKLYFWDWSLAETAAARFENAVAVYLMRAISSWNERGLGRFDLFYVRTRDGVEVDFLVTDHNKPLWLVEAKLSDTAIAAPLLKVKQWLDVRQACQVVETPNICRPHRDSSVMVISLDRFLHALP